jgi:hypothetical protein
MLKILEHEFCHVIYNSFHETCLLSAPAIFFQSFYHLHYIRIGVLDPPSIMVGYFSGHEVISSYPLTERRY